MPRTLDETVDYDENERTIFVENQQLAELADCTRSWVTQAANNDWLVEGMPVAKWMVQDRYGRCRGFDVPESVLEGLQQSSTR
ncbi:hypothetical protein GGP54_003429 [Salinibacter ruber]|jgi:hypothetical protein|nr:hypothetical protein [Salinibacter ruber]